MSSPANFDLADLNGANGFKLSGAAGEGSGRSVASAGDINGDGFADLIVGAPFADHPNGKNSGVSYVVFGKAAGFGANLDLSTLDGANGFKLSGVAAYDLSGWSVASAGDVNGDGFADLIVGAYHADTHGYWTGASYVVFGKAAGFAANLNLSALNGANGFKLSGVTADDESGASVASAGDVNGDGFADVIVGAPYANPHGGFSGASYVVFGKAGGFAANLELSTLNGANGFKLSGAAEDDRTGWSVASAGDVNGDGYADLIVGAPGGANPSGASYVVFGKAAGFAANLDLSSLNGANGFKLSGQAAADRASVASAGDVNGDGFADLIVGAYTADPHGSDSGASYVVFGKASGFGANLDLSTLDGANGFKLSGKKGDTSGRSVASAGDVNGDGFADLIVGAPGANPHGSDSGASYVVFGKAAGFAANLDLSSLNGANGFKLSGVAADDRSGFSVASAGDINADGFADLIVGALGPNLSGASYVVFGGSGVTITGTSGADLVDATHTVAGQALPTDRADTIDGKGGKDDLSGLAGNDTIVGGKGADALHGNDGNDNLRGKRGPDRLDGGAGDDSFNGGKGKDALTGGEGDDTFVFAHPNKPDTVTDFTDGDLIALAKSAFSGIGPKGVLKAKYFHDGAEAETQDQHILYDAKSGWLLYARNGSDTADPLAFARIGKNLDHFDHGDIIVT